MPPRRWFFASWWDGPSARENFMKKGGAGTFTCQLLVLARRSAGGSACLTSAPSAPAFSPLSWWVRGWLPRVRPLPHGRGSDAKSRRVNEAIRATTVREWWSEGSASSPSTGTCGGRPGGPSAARWPSFVSPRIPRSDMRRSVSGCATVSRIQRCNGGTSSSWSPLTGESPASSVAGGNNGNRSDSCQAPLGVGDLAVPEIPPCAVGVMTQKHCRVHKNPTPLSGRKNPAGQCRQNRICI